MDEDFETLWKDIFTCLWKQFGISPQGVPNAQRKDFYNSSCIIRSVVRAVNLNQILCREIFYKLFAAEMPRLESENNLFRFIFEVIEFVFQKSEKGKTYDVFTKIIQFLTVLTEIVLFRVSKDLPTYMECVPGFWKQIFTSRLSKEFDDGGGLKMFEMKCNQTINVEPYLNDFISKHCLPYTEENLYEKYRIFVANRPPVSNLKINEKEYKKYCGYIWEYHPKYGSFPEEPNLTEEIFQYPVKYLLGRSQSTETSKTQNFMKATQIWLLTCEVKPEVSIGEDLNCSTGVYSVDEVSSSKSREVSNPLPEAVDKLPRNLTIHTDSNQFGANNKVRKALTEKELLISLNDKPSTEKGMSEKQKMKSTTKSYDQVTMKSRLVAKFSLEPKEEKSLAKSSPKEGESPAKSSPKQGKSLAKSSKKQEKSLAKSSPKEKSLAKSSPKEEKSLAKSSPKEEKSLAKSSPKEEKSLAKSNPKEEKSLAKSSPRKENSLAKNSQKDEKLLTISSIQHIREKLLAKFSQYSEKEKSHIENILQPKKRKLLATGIPEAKKGNLLAKFNLEPKEGKILDEICLDDRKGKVLAECSLEPTSGKSLADNSHDSLKEKSLSGGSLGTNEVKQLTTVSEAHKEERIQEIENSPGHLKGKFQNKDCWRPAKGKSLEKEESYGTKKGNSDKSSEKKNEIESQAGNSLVPMEYIIANNNSKASKKEKLSVRRNSLVEEILRPKKPKDGKYDVEYCQMLKERIIQYKLPENHDCTGVPEKPNDINTVKYSVVAEIATELENILFMSDSPNELETIKNRVCMLQSVGRIKIRGTRCFSRSKSVVSYHLSEGISQHKEGEGKSSEQNDIPKFEKRNSSIQCNTVKYSELEKFETALEKLFSTVSPAMQESMADVKRMNDFLKLGNQTRSESWTPGKNDSPAEPDNLEHEIKGSPSRSERRSIEKELERYVTGIAPQVEKPNSCSPAENERILDRFAEDIFSMSCEYFKTSSSFIHKTDNEPNYYEPCDMLRVVSTTVICNQIINRKWLYECFDRVMKSGLPFLNSPLYTNSLIMITIDRISLWSRETEKCDIFVSMILSLVVPIELILFLVSKGIVTHTEFFPVFWKVFFTIELVNTFEQCGGMIAFYKYCTAYNCDRVSLQLFTEEKCRSYSGENTFSMYLMWLYDPANIRHTNTSMVDDTPTLSRNHNSYLESLVIQPLVIINPDLAAKNTIKTKEKEK